MESVFREVADPKDRVIADLQARADLPRPGDTYRHYKGGLYEVVGVAIDEATLGPLVIYRPAEGNPHYGQPLPWVRTLDNFLDPVDDGVTSGPRFTLAYRVG